MMMKGNTVPNVTFKTRVRDESIGGSNPFRWEDVNTLDVLAGKRVIVFALPGAFTPTCSTYQLPGFENNADEFKSLGIDEIYCLSVNDAFVMNAWAKGQGLQNVKVLPDGNGTFTEQMSMLVDKSAIGFGNRSWRYAMVVDDCKIEEMFVEPNEPGDPYGVSSPENLLNYLKGNDYES
jgi:peroxiredoxin